MEEKFVELHVEEAAPAPSDTPEKRLCGFRRLTLSFDHEHDVGNDRGPEIPDHVVDPS